MSTNGETDHLWDRPRWCARCEHWDEDCACDTDRNADQAQWETQLAEEHSEREANDLRTDGYFERDKQTVV